MNSAVVVIYVISLERKAPEGAFLLKTGKGILPHLFLDAEGLNAKLRPNYSSC